MGRDHTATEISNSLNNGANTVNGPYLQILHLQIQPTTDQKIV